MNTEDIRQAMNEKDMGQVSGGEVFFSPDVPENPFHNQKQTGVWCPVCRAYFPNFMKCVEHQKETGHYINITDPAQSD